MKLPHLTTWPILTLAILPATGTIAVLVVLAVVHFAVVGCAS